MENFSEADFTNLRTACMTSSMRTDAAWRAGLDDLAERLAMAREAAIKQRQGPNQKDK